MADYYADEDSYNYDDEDGLRSPTMPNHSASNGLGSLADELAGAWSDEEVDEADGEEEAGAPPRSPMTPRSPTHHRHASVSSVGSVSSQRKRFARLSNETSSSILSNGSTTATNITTLSKVPPIKHLREDSLEMNDLSDDIPPSLADKMDQIEAEALRGLSMVKAWSKRQRPRARRGVTRNGVTEDRTDDEEDDPICLFLDGLQNFDSQSSIETGAQRLITAHNSLSTHVHNSNRTLRDLSLQLNTPLSNVTTTSSRLNQPSTPNRRPSNQPITEDHDDEDNTSPLFQNLLSALPQPTLLPLQDLQALHSLTAQLISQFNFMSDTLHMFRQQSNVASRKLRGAKDALREWKLEVDTVENARRWIDDGDWDNRLKRREAEGVCRDVLGGFEDVISGMERRIAGFC